MQTGDMYNVPCVGIITLESYDFMTDTWTVTGLRLPPGKNTIANDFVKQGTKLKLEHTLSVDSKGKMTLIEMSLVKDYPYPN